MRDNDLIELFGGEFADNPREKRQVAELVCKNILWKGESPDNPVFIGDGSSAYFVWAHLLSMWMRYVQLHPNVKYPLKVYTNNAAVIWRTVIEPDAKAVVEVVVMPGKLDFVNWGFFTSSAPKQLEDACVRSTCVLAVTALDHSLGPCGHGEIPRIMKQAVMEHANKLVVIADRSKLRYKRDSLTPASKQTWQRRLDKGSAHYDADLYVVATRSNNITAPYLPDDYTNVEDKIECENIRSLSIKLNLQHNNVRVATQAYPPHFLCIPPV